MENTEVEKTPAQQLADLAVKQQELQNKINQANSEKAARLIAALSATATKRKEEEENERLAFEELKRKRRQREADEQDEIDRQNEEGRLQIEQRNAAQAAEKAARKKAEDLAERIKEENQKAYAMEAELQRALLVDDADVAAVDEAKPITLETLPGPLSRLFAPPTAEDAAEKAPGYAGISSEENARRQSKLDAVENIKEFGPSKATFQTTEQPTPEPVAVENPHKKTKPSADWSSATELENLLQSQLRIHGNPQSIERLAATYESVWLIQCARKAIAQFKAKPMSWDMLIETINQLADGDSTLESNEAAN